MMDYPDLSLMQLRGRETCTSRQGFSAALYSVIIRGRKSSLRGRSFSCRETVQPDWELNSSVVRQLPYFPVKVFVQSLP